MFKSDDFSKEDLASIQSALNTEIEDYITLSESIEQIIHVWGDETDELRFALEKKLEELPISDSEEEFDLDYDDDEATQDFSFVQYSKKIEQTWLIGISDEFKKSINKIDKKLKGRILDAIEKLSRDPLTLIGNTIKPLSGELDGLYRYRVGDYRLIYEPNRENRHITLLTFSARGSSY